MSVSKEEHSIRLQKFISDCGYTSRRKAEELIVQKRVEVNGKISCVLGTKVNPHHDVVIVDGQVLDVNSVEQIYILMNKPRGYVTTLNDPEGRKTVMDLCPDVTERIYPVGRLDYLSEGLLILTNDGELANMVMHPSNEIIKVYEVKLFGAMSEAILKKLRKGIQLPEGFIKPLFVRVIKQLPNKTWLEFRLGEGRNREIRRLCEAAGLTVDKLRRITIGGLSIKNIAPGNYQTMTKNQLIKGLEESNAYFSQKRTIDLKKKGPQKTKSANDKVFYKFRREHYFETLKSLKDIKLKDKELAIKKEFEEKEAKHLERKIRKEKKQAKSQN